MRQLSSIWPVRRVLVIDDEPEQSAVLARLLRADLPDVEVEAVDTGEAALTALRTRPFDLLLCDVMMPGMGGAEFLSTLRDEGVALPVVIVSGLDGAEVERVATGCEAAAWFTKPVVGAQLAQAARGLMAG